ncbi:MAG: THUMP domain-containing protein [Actinomycetota bacterium]|nr:THUMP domain-containing protein [Actinomycetota bacterium]
MRDQCGEGHPHTPGDEVLLVSLAGEIHVKSARTRGRFQRMFCHNLERALDRLAPGSRLEPVGGGRLLLTPTDLAAAVEAARTTFGCHRVERARALAWNDGAGGGSLEELAERVAEAARASVAGRTFAVRVRRRGDHPWGSPDAQRLIGDILRPLSCGVDLDAPEVEVRVLVLGPRAWVVEEAWAGPGGMPLGTQDRCLALLSGGFDSPVAAWMVMRRGSRADFLHVRLDCAQTEQALAVAYELWRRWGSGSSPLVWVVDFAQVKQALLELVPPRLRQVLLKQLMFSAADLVARDLGIPALVTGESIGQVSSQTLHHLAEIDPFCTRTVLRPLVGFDKEEIIARSRTIGTHGLSLRAQEVCDLAGGPVAVAARRPTLARAQASLPDGLVAAAVVARRVIALEHWVPGMEAVPVVDVPPTGVPVVRASESVPESGPVAVTGRGAVRVASRLSAAGRKAWACRAADPRR